MKTQNEKRDSGIIGKMLVMVTIIVFALFACSVDSLFDSRFTQVTGVLAAVLMGVCFWMRPCGGEADDIDREMD